MWCIRSGEFFLCVQSSGQPTMSKDTISVAKTEAELAELLKIIEAMKSMRTLKMSHPLLAPLEPYLDGMEVLCVTIGQHGPETLE